MTITHEFGIDAQAEVVTLDAVKERIFLIWLAKGCAKFFEADGIGDRLKVEVDSAEIHAQVFGRVDARKLMEMGLEDSPEYLSDEEVDVLIDEIIRCWGRIVNPREKIDFCELENLEILEREASARDRLSLVHTADPELDEITAWRQAS